MNRLPPQPPADRSATRVIRAVVSDVDGTLVTSEKVLTDRAIAAVKNLHDRGIPFTIISSRPPRGMRTLIPPLRISLPFAAFNGGVVATPTFHVITEHLIPAQIAQRAFQLLQSRGVQIWVFAGEDWYVHDASAPLVHHEVRTVGFQPVVVNDLAPSLERAAKIVGVSQDHELLARCEQELSLETEGSATVARSQAYYLDITHPLANKGNALALLSTYFAVPTDEIAVLGDGKNDIAMFIRSGFSVAMANASAEVKARATKVTASNDDEGFAEAIAQLVLPRVEPRPRS